MKTFKNVMMVVVSLFFIVGLCSQAWAKKQTGPAPGKMSVSDLKKYNFTKIANASRLDITPSKFVEPGKALSFRGTIVYSADFLDKINQYKDDPDDYFKSGDDMLVFIILMSNGILLEEEPWMSDFVETTYPEPGRSVTMPFTEKYHVPLNAKQGQVLTFNLVFMGGILAESSVEVRMKLRRGEMRPGIEEQRTIDRKPIIEQKPTMKEQQTN